MSVRIYQLSKQINLSNKELIALLQERGLKVDSPSNTIPDIYAEELIKEFQPKKEELIVPESPKVEKGIVPETIQSPIQPQPTMTQFVKSASQIQKERDLKTPKTSALIEAPSSVVPKKVVPSVNTSQVNAPFLPKFGPQPPKPSVPVSLKSEALNTEIDKSKPILLKPPIVVRDFALSLGLKPFRLISELMEMGTFASMNQAIEEPLALKIAEKHGFTLDIRHRGEAPVNPVKKEAVPVKEDKPLKLEVRPAVVCVLGHVDHGKTSLLDTIRKTNVTAGEAGGITQHIGAYQVVHNNQKITFIDTPGHAAFSKMRQRGANVTDIAILVVAADDGFMPQTDEALKFAQKANVPIIVAINKMDAKGANIDKVKQQMQQRGITSEDWGGQTLCTPISAIKKQNIDTLLELVLLQAEMLELKAPVDGPSRGTVMESQMELGRGPTASVIVQSGTLKLGTALVCGPHYCKVKALLDDTGKSIKLALPATPVRIVGWSSAPESGCEYEEVKNEKLAKQLAEENAYHLKTGTADTKQLNKKVDVNSLFEAIASSKQKSLRVIIKGDVHGSVEALKAYLETIKSDKVNLEILSASVGSVTPSDVASAQASQAAIVGFNTKLEHGVQNLLKQHNIIYIHHNIIYELITQVKDSMADLLEPELKENKLGLAQVRQVFPLGKSFVAGCMVTEGIIKRDGLIRLVRNKKAESESRITTLKRFKEDVNEVKSGYECGIQLNNFDSFSEGDFIECYEIIKIKPTL